MSGLCFVHAVLGITDVDVHNPMLVQYTRKNVMSLQWVNECRHAPHLEQGPAVLAAVSAFCHHVQAQQNLQPQQCLAVRDN